MISNGKRKINEKNSAFPNFFVIEKKQINTVIPGISSLILAEKY